MSISYKKFVSLMKKYESETNKDKKENKNKLGYQRVFNKGKNK